MLLITETSCTKKVLASLSFIQCVLSMFGVLVGNPRVHKRWTFSVVNTGLCEPSVHPADVPTDSFCPGFLRTSLPLIPWWPNPGRNLLLLLTQSSCHLSPPGRELKLHPCIHSSNIDQKLLYDKSPDRLWGCDGDSHIASTFRISWVHRKKAQ